MAELRDFADGRSGDLLLERKLLDTFQECFRLWQERRKKYGSSNIGTFGALGCMVRAMDKLERLRQHYIARVEDMREDSVRDSWRDGTNYFLMGLMCHLGLWPGTECAQSWEADSPPVRGSIDGRHEVRGVKDDAS